MNDFNLPGPVVDRIRRRMRRVPPALGEHCQRVEGIARQLAARHGIDGEVAGLTGLAHDAAKHFSATELLLRVEEYDLPVSELERRRPHILHGPIGAEMLRREDRLNDPSIYAAIYWHTTGNPSGGNPSGGDALGNIVFLADKLDPAKLKRYPFQPELRERAENDLPAAMVMFLNHNIARLLDAGALVHPAALECRNALLLASPAR